MILRIIQKIFTGYHLGFVINKSKSIATKSAIIDKLNKLILIIQSALAGIILV